MKSKFSSFISGEAKNATDVKLEDATDTKKEKTETPKSLKDYLKNKKTPLKHE